MKKRGDPPPEELRRIAEERVRAARSSSPPIDVADERRILHELEVHQIELQMQNESLRVSQAEAEAGRERYTELFDFAPIGYAILTTDDRTREINHAGARILGEVRSHLVGKRFGDRVAPADREAFANLLLGALDGDTQ